MSVKIGCDPEFFLLDTKTNKHVSAHGMIPGTKAEPHPVDGGAVQVDGMALEFNIDAASSWEEFNGNISKVLKQLRDMVDPRYEFSFVPVAHFGTEYIEAQPAEAKELGCDPDYNAYTGTINPKPDGSLGIRTASGHIHIGWTEGQDISHPDHIEACQMMTKKLDLWTGLTARLWDTDRIRQTMYGQFGTYRPKHYGVEYRTLSNSWLLDDDRRRLIYDTSVAAFNNLMAAGGDSTKRQTNPIKWDMTLRTNRRLSEFIRDLIPFSEEFIHHSIHKYSKTSRRVHADEWCKAVNEDGHFYRPDTYEIVRYEDASIDDLRDGKLSYVNNMSYHSKMRGLPSIAQDVKAMDKMKPYKVVRVQWDMPIFAPGN